MDNNIQGNTASPIKSSSNKPPIETKHRIEKLAAKEKLNYNEIIKYLDYIGGKNLKKCAVELDLDPHQVKIQLEEVIFDFYCNPGDSDERKYILWLKNRMDSTLCVTDSSSLGKYPSSPKSSTTKLPMETMDRIKKLSTEKKLNYEEIVNYLDYIGGKDLLKCALELGLNPHQVKLQLEEVKFDFQCNPGSSDERKYILWLKNRMEATLCVKDSNGQLSPTKPTEETRGRINKLISEGKLFNVNIITYLDYIPGKDLTKCAVELHLCLDHIAADLETIFDDFRRHSNNLERSYFVWLKGRMDATLYKKE